MGSFPTGAHPRPLFYLITPSPPTHCPMPNLYKASKTPLRTTVLMMATATFTKTEHLQHSMKIISESQTSTSNITVGTGIILGKHISDIVATHENVVKWNGRLTSEKFQKAKVKAITLTHVQEYVRDKSSNSHQELGVLCRLWTSYLQLTAHIPNILHNNNTVHRNSSTY